MPALLDRLKNELDSKGVKDSYGLAVYILKKNGYLDDYGELTDKGKMKQNMPQGTYKLDGNTIQQQAVHSLYK